MNHLDKILQDLSKSPIMKLKFKDNMNNLRAVVRWAYKRGYEKAKQDYKNGV